MKTTQQLLAELIDSGTTQNEISRATKIPQPTISRIFNGMNKSPFAQCHGVILEYHQSVTAKLNSVQ